MRWLVVIGLASTLASCGAMGVASESRKYDAKSPGLVSGNGGGASLAAIKGKSNIRIREYFPETLYWNPQLITDKEGRAQISLTMADSITTWRLTALANAKNGALGSTTKGIRVFQNFFVDIDFPVSLTQNDMVQVPVTVYNYLKEAQIVHLEVEKAGWFELLDNAVKSVHLKAGEVKAVHFKVRVKDVGAQKLTVFAKSTDSQDAIRRQVEVVPDGKKFEIVMNDRLSEKVFKSFDLPTEAIKGSVKVFCKCYPGVYSQVIEGIEGMLGMPHG